MKPIKQTKLHVEGQQKGNCMNAAFASLLEIDIETIPHFEDMPNAGEGTKEKPSWWKAMNDWLAELGFYIVAQYQNIYFEGYYIANGPSPRGVEHSVVYKGSVMVHDPHPSGAGIEKITSAWVLVPIDPAVITKRFSLRKPNNQQINSDPGEKMSRLRR